MGLAIAGTGSLAACGGNGSSNDDDGSALGADDTSHALGASGMAAEVPAATATAPVALPASTGRMRFTVLGGTPWLANRGLDARAVPYALGYAFKRGDVPRGSSVFADRGSLQVVPRNHWSDGSLRFAQLAGRVDLSGGAGAVVSLSVGPATAAGPALTTADLRRRGLGATIGCGRFGSANWNDADWDTPFQTWVSGPEMSSWIYRKPVAGDAHLVAWLEVRAFAGGAVEVLPWIENGYIRVPSPSSKNTTFVFALGKKLCFSQAIDLKHHQRTPLLSGSALSYWLDVDPAVTVHHDRLYLQDTELVPTYLATVPASSPRIAQLPASFTPLQAGSFNYDNDNMAAAGYQDPIGLLPQHDALYLTSDCDRAYGAVVRNGYSAGRWGIHYRDENTQRPLRFADHPTLVIADGQGFKDNGSSTTGSRTPAATGGNPPGWDVAHSPSVGFLAYLVTGRWYFMEQVQFATTCNYLGNGDNTALRTGNLGLVQTAAGAWQTRSCAWDWRARVQALCVTPDDDTHLRPELIRSVQANIEHFHARYVAQPNNPYGWILPGENYDSGGFNVFAPWQQDFVTAAFGYSLCLDLPVSAGARTKLSDFFHWKAKSVVMRLGPASGFWYVNGAPYTLRLGYGLSSASFTTGAGPWLPNEAAVYAASYSTPPAWFGRSDGTLAGEIMPGENAMWGNLQPAIAYAVRHGVAGAGEAYDRMTAASNWPALRSAFANRPVWGIAPKAAAAVPVTAAGQPAWLAGRALNEWFEIPGTAGAGGSAVNAFSGMALDERSSALVIAAAGGHGDSFDNRVVSISLAEAAPRWQQLKASSLQPAINVAYYADGTPSSRHLYSSCHVVEALDRVFLVGARATYGSAHDFASVDAFHLGTRQWDPAGTWAPVPAGGGFGAVKVRASGDIYTTSLYRWAASTQSWSRPITTRAPAQVRWPMAHDSRRNVLFTLQWADGQGYGTGQVHATRTALDGSVQEAVSFRPSAALSQFQADAPTYAGMDYDVDNDRFLFYCGQGSGAGRIYVVTPEAGNVWSMGLLGLGAGSIVPRAAPPAGVHSRFRYVPQLKGFVLLADASANLYFIRTA